MLIRRETALAALTALATCLWPAYASAGEEARPSRVVDVRQVISTPANRPGPACLGTVSARALELGGSGEFLDGASVEFDGEERAMTEEDLLAAINEMIPASDREDEDSLELLHGRLYATLAPENMRRLELFLEKLAGAGAAVLGLRAFFFDPAAAGQELKAGAVEAAEAERLRERAMKSGGWWDEMSLCGMENRRFHAVKGCQSTYLAEYDVEVAQGSSIFDPVMSSIETGLLIDVKPCLSSDGLKCSLTLRISCSFPATGKGFIEIDTPSGRMQKPDLATSNLQTTALVSVGDWIMISTSGSPEDPAPGGRSLGVAVLLKVERLGARARPPAEKDK